MHARHHAFATLLLAASAIACNEGPSSLLPTSPNLRGTLLQDGTPEYEVAQAVGGRVERGTEDDILRLESFLPGLGGIYVKGDSVVVFAPPGQPRSETLRGIARGIVTLNLDEKTRGQIVRGERIGIREGKYPFSQLVVWQESGAMASIMGVSGIDANESVNKVTVQIYDPAVRAAVVSEGVRAGIPVDAIDVRVVSPDRPNADLDSQLRATAGGIQIATNNGVSTKICTLGFNVPNGDEERGFYTAGHCASSVGFGSTGETVYQNLPISGREVGSIAVNPIWNLTLAACGTYSLCTQVDAMYVRYDDPADAALRVAHTAGLTDTSYPLNFGSISGYWTNVIFGPYTLFTGMSIDKVGRTTGWTRGQLSQTCISVTPGYYRVLCADEATSIIVGDGDSGAPVFIGHDDSNDSALNGFGIEFSSSGSDVTSSEGYDYCRYGCTMHFNRMTRVFLYAPLPPY